jgi:flagellar basal body L-ring protein FlgH
MIATALVIGSAGNLRLLDGYGQTAWSSWNTKNLSASAVVAQLLESGNLVVCASSLVTASFGNRSITR